jgi:hypothetical protein
MRQGILGGSRTFYITWDEEDEWLLNFEIRFELSLCGKARKSPRKSGSDNAISEEGFNRGNLRSKNTHMYHSGFPKPTERFYKNLRFSSITLKRIQLLNPKRLMSLAITNPKKF